MKNDNFTNTKIYSFFESVYRLIVLNLLTVLTAVLGLGIFSFMPALVALIILVRSLSHDTDFPLITTYWKALKKNYFRVLKLSFFYFIIGLLFLFNTYFFYLALLEWKGVLNEIIFYGTLIMDGILAVAFVNACFIYVYFPNLNNRKIIRYSFVLLRAIPMRAVIIFFMVLAAVYGLYIIPLAMVFLLFSFFAYLMNLMIRNVYSRLVADGVKSLDAGMYVR